MDRKAVPSPFEPSGGAPRGSVDLAALKRRFADRSARVGIIGLGYVGLPLVKAFSAAGFHVTGFDVDAE